MQSSSEMVIIKASYLTTKTDFLSDSIYYPKHGKGKAERFYKIYFNASLVLSTILENRNKTPGFVENYTCNYE